MKCVKFPNNETYRVSDHEAEYMIAHNRGMPSTKEAWKRCGRKYGYHYYQELKSAKHNRSGTVQP